MIDDRHILHFYLIIIKSNISRSYTICLICILSWCAHIHVNVIHPSQCWGVTFFHVEEIWWAVQLAVFNVRQTLLQCWVKHNHISISYKCNILSLYSLWAVSLKIQKEKAYSQKGLEVTLSKLLTITSWTKSSSAISRYILEVITYECSSINFHQRNGFFVT
jgi:hypothetical protein